MVIKNKSKGTILAHHARDAENFVEKTVGLMFEEKQKALILHTHFGIHTFFMRIPVDVFILDDENIVVSIKENLKPYRFFFWKTKHNKVIEAPAGTAKKSKTELRDVIEIM
jgi:uncharacterized membrane protein (UPF0127 family)